MKFRLSVDMSNALASDTRAGIPNRPWQPPDTDDGGVDHSMFRPLFGGNVECFQSQRLLLQLNTETEQFPDSNIHY